jgi:hypothetical protein
MVQVRVRLKDAVGRKNQTLCICILLFIAAGYVVIEPFEVGEEVIMKRRPHQLMNSRQMPNIHQQLITIIVMFVMLFKIQLMLNLRVYTKWLWGGGRLQSGNMHNLPAEKSVAKFHFYRRPVTSTAGIDNMPASCFSPMPHITPSHPPSTFENTS